MSDDRVPDVYGRLPWVTRDYGGDGKALSMSRARLGLFVESVLRNKGNITSFWAMGPSYPRSYVQAVVWLTPEACDKVREETGIGLEMPPRIKLNQGE